MISLDWACEGDIWFICILEARKCLKEDLPGADLHYNILKNHFWKLAQPDYEIFQSLCISHGYVAINSSLPR